MAEAKGKYQQRTIGDPTPGYWRQEKFREPCRDLMEGIDAIKAKRLTYLPPVEGEQTLPTTGTPAKSPYDVRVENTTLYPFYERAVRKAVSSVLARSILLGKDVPGALVTDSENIDLRGNNLSVFIRQVLLDSVGDAGMSHVFIDHPQIADAATRADLKPSDRPYYVHVRARDYLNPDDWEIVNGRVWLRTVRFRETFTAREGSFGLVEKERIRLVTAPPLDPDGQPMEGAWTRWATYPKIGPNKYAEEPDAEGSMEPLQFIPLVTFYSGYLGYHEARPMFEPLSALNYTHLRKRSRLDNMIHRVNTPVIHRAGTKTAASPAPGSAPTPQPGPILMAAAVMFEDDDSDAKMVWVEHTGKSVETGQDDLERLERQMEKLSEEPLTGRTSETATGRVIDAEEATTQIQALAIGTKDAVEECFRIHALMRGIKGEGGAPAGGSVTLPYLARRKQLDAQEAAFVRETMEQAGYSDAEIVAELRRGGVFSDELPEPPKLTSAERRTLAGGDAGT